MGDEVERMLREFGARLRETRGKTSLRDLSDAIGNYMSHARIQEVEVQEKPTEINFVALFKLSEALQVNPIWLATGKGPRAPQSLTGEEVKILDRWRLIPDDGKTLFAALEEWVGEVVVEKAPEQLDELAARRLQRRTLPFAGKVAARDETCECDFDAADEGEPTPVDDDDWIEGCLLVRVQGSSMQDAEVLGRKIVDGCMLVVEPVGFRVSKGYGREIVIAKTSVGHVVKRYDGQRGGAIRLVSITTPPLEPIEEQGIVVLAVVRRVAGA